jgi:hypothetical protein
MTNSSNSMTLPKLNSILSADAALTKALTSIDGLLLGHYQHVMETTGRQMRRPEIIKDTLQYAHLKDVFFDAGLGAFQHIDDVGLSSELARVIHHFDDFSFKENELSLGFEQVYLIQTMGLEPHEVARIWDPIDTHKRKACAKWKKTARLVPLLERARKKHHIPAALIAACLAAIAYNVAIGYASGGALIVLSVASIVIALTILAEVGSRPPVIPVIAARRRR